MLAEILTFIAGIGVFLFSMKMLSSSLEDLCGNKIRKGFAKISNNRFKSFGLGFIITVILQSSTASVLMTIGFASAGMITLFQAIAINIGANLGSAIAPYLVSFSSFSLMEFFCALAGVGAFMQVFSKRKNVRKVSNVIIAFALIFIGLELMGSATAVFKTNEAFLNFFTSITNPILLILIGTLFTVLIQSSLGTMAVLMTLVGTSTIAGVISVESAVYLIYGANLGTSITTAIFGSLSSGVDGKRIAVFHVLNRLTGVIIFGLLSLTPWLNLLNWITEPSLKIATVNLIFNLINSIIFLPLLKPTLWLIKKIIPSKTQKIKNELEIEFVENESIAVAIAKASDKTLMIYDEFQFLFNKTIEFVQNDNLTDIKSINNELWQFVNFNELLNKYIVNINSSQLNENEKDLLERLIVINKQVDRNARNCLKIIRTITDENGKKICFSAKILKYLSKLTEKENDLFDLCRAYVKHPECDFNKENKPNFSSILNIIQELSNIKLKTKTEVMNNGFNSKLSIKKNTSYLYILNYMTLISNNILDFAFAFETSTKEFKKSEENNYQQLDIDDIEQLNSLTENLEQEEKTQADLPANNN